MAVIGAGFYQWYLSLFVIDCSYVLHAFCCEHYCVPSNAMLLQGMELNCFIMPHIPVIICM